MKGVRDLLEGVDVLFLLGNALELRLGLLDHRLRLLYPQLRFNLSVTIVIINKIKLNGVDLIGFGEAGLEEGLVGVLDGLVEVLEYFLLLFDLFHHLNHI